MRAVLFSTSLMISASHSTARPAGPAATQCDRAVSEFGHTVEVGHESRQVLEAPPEAVDLGDRHFQPNRFADVDAAVAARARSSCLSGRRVAVQARPANDR